MYFRMHSQVERTLHNCRNAQVQVTAPYDGSRAVKIKPTVERNRRNILKATFLEYLIILRDCEVVTRAPTPGWDSVQTGVALLPRLHTGIVLLPRLPGSACVVIIVVFLWLLSLSSFKASFAAPTSIEIAMASIAIKLIGNVIKISCVIVYTMHTNTRYKQHTVAITLVVLLSRLTCALNPCFGEARSIQKKEILKMQKVAKKPIREIAQGLT
mmetsp:Transcript_27697/g.48117  ORF Transcript_27697/g.48117 Transcript_27697/m.48117 type:complete len:213 (-) Transcript_27697:319-957(-)